MKIIHLSILLLLSQSAFGGECTEQKALKMGIEAIKKNFNNYKNDEPYQVMENQGNWVVFGTLPEGWRGGTPEAIIDKKTCNVVKIQHGR